MASNQTMFLNQPIVQCGLGTLTFTVPATLVNGPAVSNVIFNVTCSVTVPVALATGAGAGSGVSNGHGAGAGGGAEGFVEGDQGLGAGGVGQGFGPTNGYQQPPANVITPSTGAAVSSSLVIQVKQNGTTVYTAPTLTPTQRALQFKTPLLCNAADVITIVLTSSGAPDAALNSIQAQVQVGQGM